MQRNAASNSNIAISGNVGSGTHSIEARWRGGPWVQIAASATGTFSGTLTNQSQGQGLLEVRYADAIAEVSSCPNVGIGDIFVIAGQSNAMGPGTYPQEFASTNYIPGLFGFNYAWRQLADPTHSNAGQVDVVNNNGTAPAGGVWPRIVTRFLTNQSCPIAFVPQALNGSSILAWQPSGSHTNRASLYGSMVWRARYVVGGCKAVLWWQGETDALASMPQSTYYSNFTNFSANVFADLGVKVIPCKLQNSIGISAPAETEINNAIGQAWATDSNTLAGPDLYPITSNDAYHLLTNEKLEEGASLWWTALKAALYP